MGSKLNDEEFNNILASSLPATWDTIMMSYLENGMPSQQFVTVVCNEYYKRKTASQQVRDVQDVEESGDAAYVTRNKESSNMAKVKNNSWLIDSAMSSHITNRRENLTEFSPLQKTIKGVEGTNVPVLGGGTVKLSSRVNGCTQTIILKNVLYVPQAPNNLFSVTCLDENGRHAKMGDGIAELYDKEKNKIAIGHKVERMYILDG